MNELLFDTNWAAIVLRTLWQSSVLFILVGCCLLVLRDRVAPRWRFMLWGIVLLRLVILVTPASPLSAFNLMNPAWVTTASAEPNDLVTPLIGMNTYSTSDKDFSAADTTDDIFAAETPALEILPTAQILTSDPIEPTQVTELKNKTAFGLSHYLASIWMIGSLYFLARVVLASRRLRLRLNSCAQLSCVDTQALLTELCDQMNIRHEPTLLVSDASQSPFLAGVLKPQIVLPQSLFETASSDEIKFVLLHELAHIRRRDVLVQWLAIAVRTVYWFHPCAWLAFSRMQTCRESACDDLAVQHLSHDQRIRYGKTLITLAGQLQPPTLAPGLCGWFSGNSVQHRIVRLAHGHKYSWSQKVFSLALVAGIAFAGLTDSQSGAVQPPAQPHLKSETKTTNQNSTPDSTTVAQTSNDENTFVATRRLVAGFKNRTPVPNAKVTLFQVRGIHHKYTKIGSTVTDADGRYKFTGLQPPNGLRFQHLDYEAVIQADNRPTIVDGYFSTDDDIPRLYVAGVKLVTGQVTDESGAPIAGATVQRNYWTPFLPPGLPQATTKADGTFSIELPQRIKGEAYNVPILVSHPNFASKRLTLKNLKSPNLVLKPGCAVDGSVVFGNDKQPLKGALIRAIPTNFNSGLQEQFVSTDDAGKFHLRLNDGSYNLMMEAEGNQWVAKMQSLDCRSAKPIRLAPMEATRGGWVSGQLINTTTGQPQSKTQLTDHELRKTPKPKPKPITIGLRGDGRSIMTQTPIAVLGADGRFKIRVCPGEHHPFLTNTYTADKMDPIIVREGETTECTMNFTPQQTDNQRIAAGRKVYDQLPIEIPARVEAILAEFRKQKHPFDECETWCLLMQELVTIGKPAVPALCKELDQTTHERMLRRLAFALRAIDDPNAIPALIRAVPRTLQSGMSDYGVNVADTELAAFMRKHQISVGQGSGTHFDFGRPVNEVQSALKRIAKHKVGGANLWDITRRKDKRALESQRKIYYTKANSWAQWWDKNSADFDVTAENRRAKLPPYIPADIGDYPTGLTLTKDATVDGGTSGLVVTPVGDPDHRSRFFLDLDTGHHPAWPKELPPKDASQKTIAAATDWAEKQKLDLICVPHENQDGSTTCALKAINMQVWEIDRLDQGQLSNQLKKGTLPTGRKLEQSLLLHQNSKGELEAAKGSCFLYLTQKHGLGVIEIDDFVTTARDVAGVHEAPERTGYNRGVRFTHYQIAR